MEREIREETELLKSNGELTVEGWARKPFWKYDRSKIKASLYRIKEWDYYAIINEEREFAIGITYSDLGYASLYSIAFVDYKSGKFSEKSNIKALTRHKTGLLPSPDLDGGLTYTKDDVTFSIIKKGEKRRIIAMLPSFRLPDGRIGLKLDLALIEGHGTESINIATSWKENRKCFYYNEKLNPMKAEGIVWLSSEKIELKKRSYGVLDWGRGRWTRENTWYWGSLSGNDGDRLWGINLGYGFSDRTPASENAIIYDGKANKLNLVEFDYPEDYTSRPWLIKDNEGRLFLEMKPKVNRKSDFNILGAIKSDQNQVFGIINGWFLLDSGEKISVDNSYGFFEKVYNKW